MTSAERVVDDPDDVATALADPDLVVGLPAGAPAWQARMARFTDGPAHAGRRAEVVALVERWDPAVLGDAARDRTAAALGGVGGGVVDGMGLARRVPAAVLAAALGVADDEVDDVVARATTVVDAVAPRPAPRPPAGTDADAAAAALTGRVGPAGLAVLFQAMDATAALVGNALVAWARGTAPGEAVDHALHHDPPVLLTRRVAATGEPVTVRLGAVAPFGAGPHACPGVEPALALAGGVVAGVAGAGWAPVAGDVDVAYEDRPNLRMPARVDLSRVGGPARRPPGRR